MKRTLLILGLIVCVALMCCMTVHGQDTTGAPLPDELLNKPVSEWQLTGVTLLVIVQFLGRAYAGLRKGGGLKGLWQGIVFGTNTPKE